MTNDNQGDRIGSLLQGVATNIEREVVPPDPRFITERTARRQRRQRYRLLSVAAAVIVVGGAVAAGVILPGGVPARHDPNSPPAGVATRVASYPVRFGNVHLVVKDLPEVRENAAAISSSQITPLQLPVTSANFASVAFGNGSVWVLEQTGGKAPAACGKLVEVSASSAKISGSVAIPLCPDAVAYGAGSVWVLSYQIGVTGYQLVQVDPSTLTVRSTVTIDGGNGGVTPQGDTGAKYLFVAVDDNDVVAAIQDQNGDGQLVEVDATSGATTRSVAVPPADGPVVALGANNSAVWVGTADGWVLALDPESGALSSGEHLGSRIVSLSAANSGIWVTVNLPVPMAVTYPGLDTLRLDPTTGSIVRDTGLPMLYVATDGAAVWTLGSAPPYTSDAGLISNLDPTTGAMNEEAELPVDGYNAPDTLGVYDGSAWVINDGAGTLTKVSS